MNKHTRAPWKKGNDCIIAEIDRHVPTLIAITGNYGMGIPAVIPDDEEAEANERLMIAAPEMLEALETARSFVEEVTKAGGEYSYLDKTPIVADAYPILSGIESAIAKAQGTLISSDAKK